VTVVALTQTGNEITFTKENSVTKALAKDNEDSNTSGEVKGVRQIKRRGKQGKVSRGKKGLASFCEQTKRAGDEYKEPC